MLLHRNVISNAIIWLWFDDRRCLYFVLLMKLMTLYGYLILFVLINKKASDRVWHATLVATTGKCTINKVSSVVCIHESIGHQCLTRLSSITFAYSLQYLLGTGYVRGTWGPLAYPKKYSHESALCMRFWWICTHTQFSMDMSTLKAILSSEGIQESRVKRSVDKV